MAKGIKSPVTGRFIRNLKPKNCLVCGILFQPRKEDSKLCGRKCLGKHIGIVQNKKVTKECIECSKEFIVHKYRESEAMFCDHHCYANWMKGKAGEQSNAWQGGFGKCINCSSELSSRNPKTNLCRVCNNKINFSGKNNYFWKGGITPIAQKIRHSIKYKKWRDCIFKRDNWTCQLCNKKGGILHADHIKQFSVILENLILENGRKNLYAKAMNYKFFWDTNNGRTLCFHCHKETPTFLKRPLKLEIKELSFV